MADFEIKTSPFVVQGQTTARMMWTVSLALSPAALFGLVLFGSQALLVLTLSILFAVGTEGLYCLILKKPLRISDGSAFLTGLLLGMMMPPVVPFYIPAAASIFAVGVIKMPFGGLGRNWLNPAIAGRIAVSLVWAKEMSRWQMPFFWLKKGGAALDVTSSATVYAITGATPLELMVNHQDKILENGLSGPWEALKHFEKPWGLLDLFFGKTSGSIGETSEFLLILGAILLFYKKIIRLDLTLSFLGTFAFCAWILGGFSFHTGWFTGNVLFHLFSGGIFLGVLYMATDPVTHPMTQKGRILFGAGAGILTVLIRLFTFFPEGVMFAILAMNLATPLINRLFVVYPLGFVKKQKAPHHPA